MRKIFISLTIILSFSTAITSRAIAQGKDSTKKVPEWQKRLTIAQSMATSEQQALPAQFNVTFPKDKGASFLVNVGVNYQFTSIKASSLWAFTGEYHRNSMTDSAQNNIQLGLHGYLFLGGSNNGHSSYFLIIDPKYSWDGVARTNSAESNILFMPKWTMDPFNIGKKSQWGATTFYLSLYAGTQVQQVFPSDTTTPKGFKLRPLVKGNASFSFNRHNANHKGYDDTNPLLTIFADYDQRKTIVNTTHDGENFTHMLNTGVNYFITTSPFTVSVGASFLEGADVFSGLKAQQYFLVSLNIGFSAKN